MSPDPSPRSERIYALPSGTTFCVNYGHAKDRIREFERYFLPHIERVKDLATAIPDWRISLIGPGSAAVPVSPGILGQYRPEGSPDSYSAKIVDARGEFWLEEDQTGPAIQWRLSPPQVAIYWSKSTENYSLEQSVYATIRLIGCYELGRRRPTCLIHAAAVERQGRAVLLTGPKRSGKTTLAAALMQRGYRFVASDRLLYWRDHVTPCVAGWICTFRVAPESLDLWMSHTQRERAAIYLGRHAGQREWHYGGKFRFPAGDLLSICEWGSSPRSYPALVVDLQPDREGVPDCQSLASAEVSEILRNNTLSYVLPPPLQAAAGLTTECSGMTRLAGLRMRRQTVASMAREVDDCFQSIAVQ